MNVQDAVNVVCRGVGPGVGLGVGVGLGEGLGEGEGLGPGVGVGVDGGSGAGPEKGTGAIPPPQPSHNQKMQRVSKNNAVDTERARIVLFTYVLSPVVF